MSDRDPVDLHSSPFIDEHSPIALVATLYVIAGILMAFTNATLTARTAVRLFSRA